MDFKLLFNRPQPKSNDIFAIETRIKWLGIYSKFGCKVLSDPIQTPLGWEYNVQIEAVYKYFLWIKYKTKIWNQIK